MRPQNLITHPRVLHPGAWWLWALGLAAAASRTLNPVPLVLIIAVTWFVVSARRGDTPWAASYALFFKLSMVVIAVHLVFQVLFSGHAQGVTVLFTLPEVELPEAAGVKLGGVVTLEAVLSAFYVALQLAAIFCCIGAANALGSARQLLRYVPAALYEIGIACVIALTFAPQLVTDARRVREASRLRGGNIGRTRQFGRLVMPIVEGALERSVDLAAAMDSRGYGRTTTSDPRARRITSALVVAGMLGVCLGLYGLLGGTTGSWLGLPTLLVGVAMVCRRDGARRAAHRPDPLPPRPVGAARDAGRRLRCDRRDPDVLAGAPRPGPDDPVVADPGPAGAAAGLPGHPHRDAAGVPGSPAAAPGARVRRPRAHGGGRMIELDRVSVTYAGAGTPVLSDVDLSIPEGEMVLVMGRTGSGKSTLLRAINGLVPHFSGGTLAGRVLVDGRDTATHRPRDMADLVGFVGQDPMAGFVTDNVEDELAYGMESLGLAPAVMRKRVEETLDLLGLAELRNRPLAQLSGGQQQRVAIGAVLTTHPQVLVLDEPTSALDPLAAEEVLSTLQRLVHDLGLTVVLAEHRLERVVQFVDRIVHVPGGSLPVESGDPATILATTPIAPPVVELGRAAGWSPLPLTVRDARRRSVDLRAQLDAVRPPEHAAHALNGEVAATRDLVAGYHRRPVLNGVTLGGADRRDRRRDGAQRRRQVDPAALPGRPAQADVRPGHRLRGGAGAAGARPTCCTPRPCAPSA